MKPYKHFTLVSIPFMCMDFSFIRQAENKIAMKQGSTAFRALTITSDVVEPGLTGLKPQGFPPHRDCGVICHHPPICFL